MAGARRTRRRVARRHYFHQREREASRIWGLCATSHEVSIFERAKLLRHIRVRKRLAHRPACSHVESHSLPRRRIPQCFPLQSLRSCRFMVEFVRGLRGCSLCLALTPTTRPSETRALPPTILSEQRRSSTAPEETEALRRRWTLETATTYIAVCSLPNSFANNVLPLRNP